MKKKAAIIADIITIILTAVVVAVLFIIESKNYTPAYDRSVIWKIISVLVFVIHMGLLIYAQNTAAYAISSISICLYLLLSPINNYIKYVMLLAYLITFILSKKAFIRFIGFLVCTLSFVMFICIIQLVNEWPVHVDREYYYSPDDSREVIVETYVSAEGKGYNYDVITRPNENNGIGPVRFRNGYRSVTGEENVEEPDVEIEWKSNDVLIVNGEEFMLPKE